MHVKKVLKQRGRVRGIQMAQLVDILGQLVGNSETPPAGMLTLLENKVDQNLQKILQLGLTGWTQRWLTMVAYLLHYHITVLRGSVGKGSIVIQSCKQSPVVRTSSHHLKQ
jgi:hypothetical protein